MSSKNVTDKHQLAVLSLPLRTHSTTTMNSSTQKRETTIRKKTGIYLTSSGSDDTWYSKLSFWSHAAKVMLTFLLLLLLCLPNTQNHKHCLQSGVTNSENERGPTPRMLHHCSVNSYKSTETEKFNLGLD